MASSCLFCGASRAGVLSNEHVIPKWLLEHLGLPADDMLIQGVASSATETLVQPPRIHSSFNFVQGHVCGECNTGWMSLLEVAAKPILVPLIENERPIDSLTPEEGDIVGKWVIKTAYMHSWTSPLKKPVQPEHLQALRGDGGKPIPGVAVFGMQSDFKKQSAYFQSGFWPQLSELKEKHFNETPDGAYKIGLQFRHLYLLAAFWPNVKSALTLFKGLHVPIFPTAQDPWPDYSIGDPIVGDGPVDRLAVFTKWLAVSHPKPRVLRLSPLSSILIFLCLAASIAFLCAQPHDRRS